MLPSAGSYSHRNLTRIFRVVTEPMSSCQSGRSSTSQHYQMSQARSFCARWGEFAPCSSIFKSDCLRKSPLGRGTRPVAWGLPSFCHLPAWLVLDAWKVRLTSCRPSLNTTYWVFRNPSLTFRSFDCPKSSGRGLLTRCLKLRLSDSSAGRFLVAVNRRLNHPPMRKGSICSCFSGRNAGLHRRMRIVQTVQTQISIYSHYQLLCREFRRQRFAKWAQALTKS